MESRRNPGPASLRHHDAVIGSLRSAGFDIAMAAHAYSLLDSYVYGFALTKMNLPFQSTAEVADVAQTMLEPFPMDAYPNLVEFITEHAMKPGYDYADEFGWGLDAVLDALESRFATVSMSPGRRPVGVFCGCPRVGLWCRHPEPEISARLGSLRAWRRPRRAAGAARRPSHVVRFAACALPSLSSLDEGRRDGSRQDGDQRDGHDHHRRSDQPPDPFSPEPCRR